MQPSKNVLELLGAFLPPLPVHEQPGPNLATSEVATAKDEAGPVSQQAEKEETAVLDFIAQQTLNSGLLDVSTALLGRLLSHPGHAAVQPALEDLFHLEAPLRGQRYKALMPCQMVTSEPSGTKVLCVCVP